MTREKLLELCDYLECNDASLEAQCEAAAFIRKALAQPEQEPVAHVCVFPLRGDEFFPQTRIEWKNGRPVAGPLYTTPPQRKPLTDEQIDEAWSSATGGSIVTDDMRAFARTIYSIKGDT